MSEVPLCRSGWKKREAVGMVLGEGGGNFMSQGDKWRLTGEALD